MQQETSLVDDHASDDKHGQRATAVPTIRSGGAAAAPAAVLEKDIIGTTTTATTTTTSGRAKSVETRRKELNELWHKLSHSTTDQRRVEKQQQQEEEEKKQDEEDHNPTTTNQRSVEAIGEVPHQNDKDESVNPTPPQTEQQQHHAQQQHPTAAAASVSASIVLDMETTSAEEKKHEESIHNVVHEEHAEGSIHIVQLKSLSNNSNDAAAAATADRSVVLVDSLAHESIMALNSLRMTTSTTTTTAGQQQPQQQHQQHDSLALSSTRLRNDRSVVSKPIPSPPIIAQQQQQQQQQPQDYLRHGTAPNTTGQPKKAGTSWWERVVVQRSSYVVEDLVDQYTADSLFLQSPALPVAFLDRIELQASQLLGSGTYSNVSRVQQLQLLPNYLADHPQQDELRKAFVGASHQAQANAGGNPSLPPNAALTTTTESTGYAIKHLKSELLKNSKLFEAAAADLIMEAKFLSRMDHPNILKLRGMALGGTSTFAATGLFDSYFLVVDELQETLIQRIHRWKVQGSTDQYMPAMVLEKLKLAVQVASALAYLHHRRLVFRDLKPHNIGLKKLPYHQSIDTTSSNGSLVSRNSNGDSNIIQLFDFGFCRELPNPMPPAAAAQPLPTMVDAAAASAPPTDAVKSNVTDDSLQSNENTEMEDVALDSPTSAVAAPAIDEDQVFCMSGKGTLLYMASEVLSSSRCYNQKADVYSWSMVTYELLTLQKPFAVGSIEQHKKAICERGERPPLGHLRWLDTSVKDLLQHSWQADVNARWHMRDIKNSLETIIADLETRKGFRKDGSFGSFGYGTSKSADGKESQSFNFCQSSGMTDMILDFTNAVQTRYGEYLFCSKDTTAASTAASTTCAVADSEAAIAPSGKSLEHCATENSKPEDTPDREISLKSYQNTAEERSLRFDIPETKKEAADRLKDNKPKASIPTELESNKQDEKPAAVKTPTKSQGDDFYTSAKKSLWGGFARPHMSRVMRAPTTANTSEQDFSERSLSMHSVRLQEAQTRRPAQNRRPTAWVAPRRLTSVNQSRDHGRASYDEYGRARPYASRSLRAHSAKLDATIELENEDEEDAGTTMMFENSLILPSIKLGGNGQEHLEEITEEAGSSLRSTATPMGTQSGASSLRSTSTPAPSSLRSINTPIPSDCAEEEIIESVDATTEVISPEVPMEASPMTLDPNTAPVGSRDVANNNAATIFNDDEGEEGFGSIALGTSTRIKTCSAPQKGPQDEDKDTSDGSAVKDFIVATASI